MAGWWLGCGSWVVVSRAHPAPTHPDALKEDGTVVGEEQSALYAKEVLESMERLKIKPIQDGTTGELSAELQKEEDDKVLLKVGGDKDQKGEEKKDSEEKKKEGPAETGNASDKKQ